MSIWKLPQTSLINFVSLLYTPINAKCENMSFKNSLHIDVKSKKGLI
jgi:hypothetical protein